MLLFGIYLVVVVGLPIALSVIVGLRGMPLGRACPACAQETLPVVSRLLTGLRRMHIDVSIQRRWCPTCAWDGYARAGGPAADPGAVPVSGSARQTLQVRTLELGGRPWRVLLESWQEHGRYLGRLLFVGPSGKLWHDPFASLSAQSHGEIVKQARSLSDRLLAYRLRDVISG